MVGFVTTHMGQRPVHEIVMESRERRARLTACATLYACALGVAAIFISIFARTDPLLEPQRLAFAPSLFFALAGAVAGGIFVWPTVYFIAEQSNQSRHILIWVFFGLAFGLILPFVTGLLVPISGVFIDLTRGIIDAGSLPSHLFSAALRAPLNSFVSGTLTVFTGIIAGTLFGPGVWLMDRLNASSNQTVSRVATWGVALALSFALILLTLIVPPETLARIG